MEADITQLRNDLITAGRDLFEAGLVVGSCGNVSLRIPGTNQVLIKPTGVCMSRMVADEVITVDLDGKKLQGKLSESSETKMHVAIYKKRPEIGAIAHTHAPVATALGSAGKRILAVNIEGFTYGNGVPIAEFGYPGTWELANGVAKTLGMNNAVILEFHGVATTGRTIQEATMANITLEEMAKIQFMQLCIGRVRTLTKVQRDTITKMVGGV